jgi:MFS family permease
MRSGYSLGSKASGGHGIVIVALLFFSTAINHLDRQTLSMIAPLIHDQLSISPFGYSRIIFALMIGYMINQALAGKRIDWVGTRLGMLLCVGVWSAAAYASRSGGRGRQVLRRALPAGYRRSRELAGDGEGGGRKFSATAFRLCRGSLQ